MQELPAFTSEHDETLDQLQEQSQSQTICIEAKSLFTQLLDILTDELVLALNPGSPYGIRINRPILLGLQHILANKH